MAGISSAAILAMGVDRGKIAYAEGTGTYDVNKSHIAFHIPSYLKSLPSYTGEILSFNETGELGDSDVQMTLLSNDEIDFSEGAQTTFERLASRPGAHSACWGLQRIDRDGIEMARASIATFGDAPTVGVVYMAHDQFGRLLELRGEARTNSPLADCRVFEGIWDGADWPRSDRYAAVYAQADSRVPGWVENRQNADDILPRYNGYWAVMDARYVLDTIEEPNVHPSRISYKYATPEGIEAWESELCRVSIMLNVADVFAIWAMRRTDSNGDAYFRSTVDVEGIGVADIAYYPGYSCCWYVAETGLAVWPGQKDHIWRSFGIEGEDPWTPHFFN